MAELHRLLRRQLQRHPPAGEPPLDLEPLLAVVDQAYRQSDDDRALLERALEISSRELIEANTDLRTLFDLLPDLILRIDRAGRVVACHPSSAGELPLGSVSWIGMSIESPELSFLGPELPAAVADARRTGTVAALEVELGGDGAQRVCEARLVPVGKGDLVIVVRDVTSRRQAEELLEHFAYHDPLTGLPNRRLFDDRLEHAVERARRQRERFGVLYVDLDQFKEVNDRFGHRAGDRLLKAVSERLAAKLRSSDTLARVGGDEFMLLIETFRHPEDLARVAEILLRALEPPIDLEGLHHSISASIGVAIFPYDGESGELLVRSADAALYRAKASGRNRFQIYTPELNAQAVRRLELERALRDALERGELVVRYQPRVEVASGSVVAVEAQLHWQRAGRLLPPEEFIEVAAEIGLASELGAWTLRTACSDLGRLGGPGSPALRVAVDLGAAQLRDRELAAVLRQILAETGTAPERLELVLAGEALAGSSGPDLESLDELRQLGVTLAIGQFGAGGASFAAVARLPLAALEIERGLVGNCDRDPRAAAVVGAIVALTQSLGLRSVAAGVEWPAQADLLRRHGCVEMHGPLCGRLLRAEELSTLLQVTEAAKR